MKSEILKWDRDVDKIIYLIRALKQLEIRKRQRIRVREVIERLRGRMRMGDVNKGIAILIKRGVVEMQSKDYPNRIIRFV